MIYYLDDLTIDTAKQQVWRSKQNLKVSGLNFQFLSFMLSKDNTIVTFDELILGVWSPTIVHEDTVVQRVRLLRRALGDDKDNPRYIRSVRGQGYQLVSQPVTNSIPLKKTSIFSSPSRYLFGFSSCVLVLVISLLLLPELNKTIEFDSFTDDSNKNSTDKFIERANYYASIGQKDNTDRAIELFQRVLLTEPKNTRAMIGLSRAYTISMCRFNADWSQAVRAEVLARNVIAVEPENFAAFRALGFSQDCRGQTLLARDAYMQAIKLDPDNDLISQSALAYSLGESGELAKALEINLYVSHADPKQTFSLIQLGRVYELLGLHSKAESLYVESFDLYPDNIFSNLSYPRHLFHQGKFAAARKIVFKAKERPTHPDLLVLSAELALLDNDTIQARNDLLAAAAMRPSAEHLDLLVKLYPTVKQPIDWLPAKLAALKENSKSSDPEDWLKHAMIHQALGDYPAGIHALVSAVESGYRNANYLKRSPFFKQLRSNSEFDSIIKSINLEIKREQDKIHASGLLNSSYAGL